MKQSIEQILWFDHIWCLPLIICSFCMELKLFFTLIQLVLKLCDFFPKQWKPLIIANTTSIVPVAWNLLHYILCEILLEYQLGWNIEYLEYLSIYIYIYVYILWSKIVSNKCHIWMVMFIVQCKPKSTLKSIKIYKCKLWHLLWEILAKT